MTRVLVVDDEPQILRAMRINLAARQYDVVTANSGKQALDAVARMHPDLVVLDLGLPDLDGIDVIHALRGWSKVPIIVLSGRAQSEMKIRALEAGADDYVSKPFNVDELIARVRAVARRSASPDEAPTVRFGDIVVDLAAHRVTRAVSGDSQGDDVRLTPTEWQLLQILLRNPGKLITQRQLLRALRGPSYDDASHLLRQYMAQLRQKLEPNPPRPRYLLTEPGMGYRFQPGVEQLEAPR
jgi:two-component system, OmpR family, KDP operon response regulator KdpE